MIKLKFQLSIYTENDNNNKQQPIDTHHSTTYWNGIEDPWHFRRWEFTESNPQTQVKLGTPCLCHLWWMPDPTPFVVFIYQFTCFSGLVLLKDALSLSLSLSRTHTFTPPPHQQQSAHIDNTHTQRHRARTWKGNELCSQRVMEWLCAKAPKGSVEKNIQKV